MPPHVLLHEQSKQEKITSLSKDSKVIALDHIKYDNGIFAYYKGAEYPMRGFTSSETLFNVDIMKAILMGVFALRPNVSSCLKVFNRIGYRLLSIYFLKSDYMSPICRELQKGVYNFLISYKIDHDTSNWTSLIISHLFEYDNAYRLRLVDIMSEADKNSLLANPRKEIKRLLNIYMQREYLMPTMRAKINRVIKPLLWLLYVPKVRRAFSVSIQQADFASMKYDNIDLYWAFLREDYNYKGLDHKQRMDVLKANGYSLPMQTSIMV